MIADKRVISLPKVSLETRELLPEESGIYYVVDQHEVIVYIGQAANLKNRWQGSLHHRFKQLKAIKNRSFHLYYEIVPESQLDDREKYLIDQFNPEFNDSRVIQGKTNFTEGLLKETLRKLNGYILILGFNPQTKIIYLAFDRKQFQEDYQIDINSDLTFLNWIFKSRKTYPTTWKHNDFKYLSFMFAELLVNGFMIRIENLGLLKLPNHTKLQHFNCQLVDFVAEQIPCVTEESLIELKSQDSIPNFLKHLAPYTIGTFRYFKSNFDLLSLEEYQQKLQQIAQEFQSGKRGIGSQSTKKEQSLNFIKQLLTKQQISR